MSKTILPILLAIYLAQLIIFISTLGSDMLFPKEFRTIKTKNDFIIRLIPFGFLFKFYIYYKNLD